MNFFNFKILNISPLVSDNNCLKTLGNNSCSTFTLRLNSFLTEVQEEHCLIPFSLVIAFFDSRRIETIFLQIKTSFTICICELTSKVLMAAYSCKNYAREMTQGVWERIFFLKIKKNCRLFSLRYCISSWTAKRRSCHFAEQLKKKLSFAETFKANFLRYQNVLKVNFSDAVFQYHSQ